MVCYVIFFNLLLLEEKCDRDEERKESEEKKEKGEERGEIIKKISRRIYNSKSGLELGLIWQDRGV